MTTTPIQIVPYLKESRQFPTEDLQELSAQVDQAYIDVASKVNLRTVGIHGLNTQVVTGESFYLAGSSQKQQSLRQLYTFTAAGTYPHGIDFSSVSFFTKCWGSYTDGTNWYGVIFATSNPITNAATFYITPTDIVITFDGAAPAPTKIYINLEWVSIF